MRVLMLGWEFPPFISGGLGTACYGLTKALNRCGAEVLFVLPRTVGDCPPHAFELEGFERVTFKTLPSPLRSPYPAAPLVEKISPPRVKATPHFQTEATANAYEGDVVAQVHRYTDLCVDLTQGERFDVIHAHDWMTWPAGLKIAALTGKPLVAHVHSTEFDRCGPHAHEPIRRIEQEGLRGAAAVVCVSQLTRNLCVHRYGVSPEKTYVCHNGIDAPADPPRREPGRRGEKIVLFLGRITMQKGPEYFIAAARLVLTKVRNVRFIVAGAGDMEHRVVQLAAEAGLGAKVLFTGFLNGPDVERVLDMADVYVMPSVSEPFGIAPLEAIRRGVPVILSRNSGVSEVLSHVLKVDFWDVPDIADKIIALLRHPPLGRTLRERAGEEVRGLTWQGAAEKCLSVYDQLLAKTSPSFS